MAIDRPEIGIDDMRRRTIIPTYRPTLLLGGLVTTAGALGLGATSYLFLSSTSDADADVAPLVNVSSEGASVGVAGTF